MTTVVLREQLTADSALFHFSTFLSPVKPTSTQTMDLVCTLTILALNKHVRLNYSQHISQHFFEMTSTGQTVQLSFTVSSSFCIWSLLSTPTKVCSLRNYSFKGAFNQHWWILGVTLNTALDISQTNTIYICFKLTTNTASQRLTHSSLQQTQSENAKRESDDNKFDEPSQ